MTVVGINIKNIRMNRGLTQAEFAKQIGISDKAISTYENGTRNPKMDVIIKIANTFHLTPNEILESNPSDAEMQMLSKFRALSATDKEDVLAFIDFKLSRIKK